MARLGVRSFLFILCSASWTFTPSLALLSSNVNSGSTAFGKMTPSTEPMSQNHELSSSQVEELRVKRDGNSSTNLELACLAAQTALGVDQVDTSPLNQTVVDENWCETANPCLYT